MQFQPLRGEYQQEGIIAVAGSGNQWQFELTSEFQRLSP
jgi:hypothetical protein